MKITLACIVGNEEAVIERFIRSFVAVADAFVFVRAIGNQKPDKTKDLIVSTLNEYQQPFVFSDYKNEIDLPHVDNFGKARQLAWSGATISFDSDYIMWADADDVISEESANAANAAAESASHDVFIMPYHVRGDKQIVMRERMVKASIGSYWQYAIHEQLAFPNEATYRIIKDAIFLHQPLHTKSGGHERNVAILENEVKDAWRNFFYLSQEYFYKGDDKKFIKYANAALACPNLEKIERYEILLNLAQTQGQDSRRFAAEAFALMPDRREALALLSSYSIIDRDYDTSLMHAKRLVDTDHPKRAYWSQNNEWYGWKGAELYRQCLRLTGDVDEANLEFELNKDESRPVFSIVHATLGRPEQALQIREMWLSRARCPENVEYIFGLHSFDERTVNILKGFKYTVTDQKGAGWNYDTAAGATTGQIIIQAQDDCYPPDGWDDAIIAMIPDASKPVVVFPNDGHRDDMLAVNVIQTRAYQKIKASRDAGENGFFHRGYTTVFPDTEHSFRAIEDSKAGIVELIDARDFVLYHDHPAFNPAKPWDKTYEWENAPENYISGRKLFQERNPTATDGSLNREPEKVEARDKNGKVVAVVNYETIKEVTA